MKTIIITLAVLLVGTNAFWVYVTFDNAVTASYRDQRISEYRVTSTQLSQVIPELASGKSREEVIKIVSRHTDMDPFEKDGCVWIGWMGLHFTGDGRLQSVSRLWNAGEKDACYPAI